MKKTLLLLFTLISFFSLQAQTLVTGQLDPVPVSITPFEIDLLYTDSSTTIMTTVVIDGMGYFNDTSSISGSNYMVTASFVDCQGNTVTFTADYMPPSPTTTGHYDFGVLDYCSNTLPNSSTIVGQFNNTNGAIPINVSYDGGLTYVILYTDSSGYLYDSQMMLTGQSSISAYFYNCNNDTVYLTASNISGSANSEYFDFGNIDFCPGSSTNTYINISGQMSPNSGVISYTIVDNNGNLFTGMTDSSGFVSLDSVPVSSLPSSLIINYLDCNGNSAMDTAYAPVILPYPAPYDFGDINYCPNVVNPPIACLAEFTVNQNVIIDSFGNIISTSNVFIGNNSQGQNLTYTWDFGDGSPAYTGVHFLHTYANAGPYVLCLTVTSPANATTPACSSTYCDSLMVDSNGLLMAKTNSGFSIQMGNGSDVSETPTGINTIENSISAFNIFPNPAKDFLNVLVETKENKTADLKIYDITGKLIQTNKLDIEAGKSSLKIKLENINKGIYLVQIKTDKGFVTRRLSVK